MPCHALLECVHPQSESLHANAPQAGKKNLVNLACEIIFEIIKPLTVSLGQQRKDTYQLKVESFDGSLPRASFSTAVGKADFNMGSRRRRMLYNSLSVGG